MDTRDEQLNQKTKTNRNIDEIINNPNPVEFIRFLRDEKDEEKADRRWFSVLAGLGPQGSEPRSRDSAETPLEPAVKLLCEFIEQSIGIDEKSDHTDHNNNSPVIPIWNEERSEELSRTKAKFSSMYSGIRPPASRGEYFDQLAHDQFINDVCDYLSRYAFIFLRRAKLKSFASRGRRDSSDWLAISIASNLVLDVSRSFTPEYFRHEASAVTKAQLNYSIALANLGRFHEASRRLDEVQALSTKAKYLPDLYRAGISLRRAECRLIECKQVRNFILLAELADQFCQRSKNNDTTTANTSDDSQSQSRAFELARGSNNQTWVRLEVKSLLDQIAKTKNPSTDPDVLQEWDDVILGIDCRQGDVAWGTQSKWMLRSKLNDFYQDNARNISPRICSCLKAAWNTESPRVGRPDTPREETSILVASRWLATSLPHLKRLYMSLLDEAVEYLDRGEQYLIGASQSAQWWSRLYSLRLRVYGLLGPLNSEAATAQVFRKIPPDRGIWDNFTQLRQITKDDLLRSIRCSWYLLDAEKWFRNFLSIDDPMRSPLPNAMKLARGDIGNLEERLKRNSWYSSAGSERSSTEKNDQENEPYFEKALRNLKDKVPTPDTK